MPNVTQEITFENGKLNWDDSRLFFGKGDSQYRLNVIPNELSSTYTLTNLKGNTSVSHNFTHDVAYAGAVYTCIGDAYDDNRDAVLLAIYSDLGNHSILRFNLTDKFFDKIAWDHTELGFDIDYPLTDMYMIGDRLHWNPRTTSPRSINTQWAYYDHVSYYAFGGTFRAAGDFVRVQNRVYVALKSTDEGSPPLVPEDYRFVDYCYGDTLPVNATVLDATVTSGEYFRYRDFYNIPPVLPVTPNAVVGTDTGYQYNNIRGRRFQFCYRQYVKDQGYTISSQYTDIIAAPASETTYGEVVNDIDAYNLVSIDILIQNELSYGGIWYQHYMLFEFVEILFREGPNDNWKIAERINYETFSAHILATGLDSYTLDFYNDRSYEVADNASVEKQYNALPITSRSQWSLDGNRTAYGGNLEGFDAVVDIDVTLAVGTNELTTSEGSGAPQGVAITFSSTYDEDIRRYLYESSDIELGTAAVADVIEVTVNGIFRSRTLTSVDDDSDLTYATAVAALLEQSGITVQVEAGDVAGYKLTWVDVPPEITITSVIRYASATTSTESFKVGSFKNGAWHPFCLFYYDDAGRRSEPVFNDDMRRYVNTLPEASIPATGSTNYQRVISWDIDHAPPSWAEHWRWGYAGNQTIGDFWQYNIEEAAYEEPKGGTVAGGNDTWTRLNITPLQDIDNDGNNTLTHYFPNTNIKTYSFEPGDRVRFITQDVATPATHLGLLIAASNEDYEILEYDDTNNYIYIADPPADPADLDDNTIIIEIYRPLKQTGTTTYYEFGPLYETYDVAGVLNHRGENQDQDITATDPATGTFVNGDVWVITRTFSLAASDDNVAFVESYGWSDFHDTDGWGKGKTGIYTGIGRKYVNQIRYGNKYEPNAQTSGLSTFDFLDYKVMSDDHGKITAMRQAGNTLKVYMERNSAAVLVNKTQFYNADGVSQILKSDNVLGDAVYSNYHYGTIFPESVYLRDRTVYFYDIYRAAYIQDSPNGLVSISEDYKMDRYFHEKSASLLTSGVANVNAFTTFDYERGLLYVIFKDTVTPANNEGVVFYDKENKWVEFATWYTSGLIVPSVSTSVSNFCSYVGEDIYLHHTNTTYNNFWGDQQTSIVEVIGNEAANVKKVYEAMAIHSNKGWDVTEITIPADETYVNGMVSKVPEARFVKREGVFYSDYLRNQKTNQATASTLDLVRGEQLRGYYIRHRLVNTDTTEVILFKVDVSGNISKV